MTKTVRIFETGSAFADILMDNTPQNIVLSVENADLAVIMQEYSGDYSGVFGTLLCPEEIKCGIYADSVVTYGMSQSSDITLSSVGNERCVMSVQREITTIYGQNIEPQEIIIPRMHLSPHNAMAVYAAFLITGCFSEKPMSGISDCREAYISKQEIYGGMQNGRFLQHS